MLAVKKINFEIDSQGCKLRGFILWSAPLSIQGAGQFCAFFPAR